MNRTEQTTLGKRMTFTIGGIAIGAVLLSGLLGMLVLREIIDIEFATKVIHFLLLAGVFAACWFLARSVPKRRLVISMAATGTFIVLGVVGKAVLFPLTPIQWRGILLTLTVGVVAGVLASKKKVKNYKYHAHGK